MNNFFKIIILSLTVNLLLTACSEEQRQELTQKIKEKQIENAVKKLPKHNEPIPEYPTLTPFKLSLDEINKNKKYVHSQIVQNINKTIYFSKIEQKNGHRDLVQNREDSEYYRHILGFTKNGHCVIQDFYSENDQKQQEPIIVKKSECESWETSPFDGMAIWYDKDGKIQEDQIEWLQQGNTLRVYGTRLREGRKVTFLRERILPDVLHTTVLSQETSPNGKHSAAICEFNTKEKKIEKFIRFTDNDNIEKYRFNHQNKIDATYVMVWTKGGSKFIDTMANKYVENTQQMANVFCGIE